jgi:hypothetical protein
MDKAVSSMKYEMPFQTFCKLILSFGLQAAPPPNISIKIPA